MDQLKIPISVRYLNAENPVVRAITDRILSTLLVTDVSHGLREPARFSRFEEFLAPDEWRALLRFGIDREPQFQISHVISPDKNERRLNLNYRRSRVLYQLEHFENLMTDRLRHYLPRIVASLGMAPFSCSHVELQLTASNDGEFFRVHNDNGHQLLEQRAITFVLFFFQEPKGFSGGALRLYDLYSASQQSTTGCDFIEITPTQNTIVFFPSHIMHEVTTVHCAEKAFRSSRFTLNGWIKRR